MSQIVETEAPIVDFVARCPHRADAPLTVAAARALAGEILRTMPDRLAHSLAVGAAAEALTALRPPHVEFLAAAAYLHDVGYGPAAHRTGMHQLDGARYLREIGVDDATCSLVAHHSYAEFEMRERGLREVVHREFPVDPTLGEVADLLTCSDLTTSAKGERITVEARFEDIFRRYEPDTVVARAMATARPLAYELVARTQERLKLVAAR